MTKRRIAAVLALLIALMPVLGAAEPAVVPELTEALQLIEAAESVLPQEPMQPELTEEPQETMQPEVPEEKTASPVLEFVCSPADMELRVIHLLPMTDAASAMTEEECIALLRNAGFAADILIDENGDTLFEMIEHTAEDGCFQLAESVCYVAAQREGYYPLEWTRFVFACSTEGMMVDVELEKIPEATAIPETSAEPTAIPEMTAEPTAIPEATEAPETALCTVRFEGMPEGAVLCVLQGEMLFAADETGAYRLPVGEYRWCAECEGYVPQENIAFTVEEDAAELTLEVCLSKQDIRAVPQAEAACVLMRVYRVDESGAVTEYQPDESGAYHLEDGEYCYDVVDKLFGFAETRRLIIDGSAESVEIALHAPEYTANRVKFACMQEGTVVSIYRMTEDGLRVDIPAQPDGEWLLPAGTYFYDAACEAHTAVTAAEFIVADSEETLCVNVWLLSDERAVINRKENVLILSVAGESKQQTKINEQLQAELEQLGMIRAEYFYNDGNDSIYYITLDNDNVWFATDMLALREDVVFAEPDYLYYSTDEGDYEVTNAWATGDQSYMDVQCWIEPMGMRSIWGELESKKVRPGEGTIVAVIDTGVDYTHPDLAPNMWVNEAELKGRTDVDDDRNGYVDDVYGYNFVADNGNPQDDHGHGTHVAGIIAMADNNTGGVGMAYGAKVMALKAGNTSGAFASTDIARAIMYAKANGADVINMSFGGPGKADLMGNALEMAFSDCVLVAAAGNDSMTTLDCPLEIPKADFYPAGYSYVIGVMATGDNGQKLTEFSNFDWIVGENCEYEIAAPGQAIYSTLPGGRYARWSGTSMAAPMVSAAAAVIRSQKGSDDAYSSRYIAGQLVGATRKTAAGPYGTLFPSLNLLDSLRMSPVPQLSVSGVELFDSIEYSEANNGDGVWQNGETIAMGIELTNRWGTAQDIEITISDENNGTVTGYTTIHNATTTMDEVGTFATANSGYIYDDGLVVGFENPLLFTIHEDVSNGVEVPITITVTAKNGMDDRDKKVYTTQQTIYLTVENGRPIYGIISEDMTLTADHMWIIRGSASVAKGVMLTVEPGTSIFFERAYTGDETFDANFLPFLRVEGKVYFNGTADKPITINGDDTYGIFGNSGANLYWNNNYGGPGGGDVYMKYVNVYSGGTRDAVTKYWDGTVDTAWVATALDVTSMEHCRIENCLVAAVDIARCQLYDCALMDGVRYPNLNDPETGEWIEMSAIYQNYTECQFVDTYIDFYTSWNPFPAKDCVFINGILTTENTNTQSMGYTSEFENNAVLYPLHKPETWVRPYSGANQQGFDLSGNFWGTQNMDLVQKIIVDSNDIVTYGTITVESLLSAEDESLEDMYPFVVDAWVEDADGNRLDVIAGAQNVTFHILYNRDMNTRVNPIVGYGPAEPYNDYSLQGEWVSPREWVADKKINPLIDYGEMTIRTQGGQAADDAWLEVGKDMRHWFTITNMGAEALTLQTYADSEGIHLDWAQDDFDTLAGYNIYRSESLDPQTGRPADPVRINPVLIPDEYKSFVDSNVEEGKVYYYYFTVVQTDFNESEGSNVSWSTALDMTLPEIIHAPADAVVIGEVIPVSAEVTDNVRVDRVTLYARAAGAAEWTMVNMTNTSGNLWFANINTSAAGVIEYYIEAFDGTGRGMSGSAAKPYKVNVRSVKANAGDVNGDDEIDILDLMLIAYNIAGTNTLGITQKAAADINGDGMIDIFDLMRVAHYICGSTDKL